MKHQKESPYVCHIFICTNDRKGARKSCADGNSAEIRTAIKAEIAANEWKPKVRVSQSGCLGLCDDGPNVMVYPQKLWFSQVTINDIPYIISKVAQILESNIN